MSAFKCHVCEKEKDVQEGFIYGARTFICQDCEAVKVRGQEALTHFGITLSEEDFVLVIGDTTEDYGRGMRLLCKNLFWNYFHVSVPTVVLFDNNLSVYGSESCRQGCAIISTVIPPEDYTRKPTYLVFTPPSRDYQWDDYFATVRDYCVKYGIKDATRRLGAVFEVWKNSNPEKDYLKYALVFSVSSGSVKSMSF